MDFQSYSLSISHRISSAVHGEGERGRGEGGYFLE